ncbi:hypothetical protein [Nesterenkonia pannonica]|nr:hypothetical protein [Nesterenkonia pannonica]
MGVPLWALGLWLGWMITRPESAGEAADTDEGSAARDDREPVRD